MTDCIVLDYRRTPDGDARDVTIVGGPRDGKVLRDVPAGLAFIRVPDPLPPGIVGIVQPGPRRNVVVTDGRSKAKPNPDYSLPEPVEITATIYRIQRDTDRWWALHPEVPL